MFCKNCGTKVPVDSKFCFSCGEALTLSATQNKNPIILQPDNLTFQEELTKLKVLIESKQGSEIVNLINEIVTSKEKGEEVLDNYSKLFNKNLIEDLANLSTRYNKVKEYVQRFIDFNIVEPNYPHKRKNQNFEPQYEWKEKQ